MADLNSMSHFRAKTFGKQLSLDSSVLQINPYRHELLSVGDRFMEKVGGSIALRYEANVFDKDKLTATLRNRTVMALFKYFRRLTL